MQLSIFFFFFVLHLFNPIYYRSYYSCELKDSLYDLQLLANSERVSKSLVFSEVSIDGVSEIHLVVVCIIFFACHPLLNVTLQVFFPQYFLPPLKTSHSNSCSSVPLYTLKQCSCVIGVPKSKLFHLLCFGMLCLISLRSQQKLLLKNSFLQEVN